MRVVFFNKPVGTQKVCFTATKMSCEALKEMGVIPHNSAVLARSIDLNNAEERAMLAHVDKIEFDSYEKPSRVRFDMDLVKLWWADVYREAREPLLEQLDKLQMRALVKGDTATIASMEADKQLLRDAPDLLAAPEIDSFVAAAGVEPPCLFVDYKEKYHEAVSS